MDENMKYAKIHVWLPVLMYCAAASLINSAISYFPFIPGVLTTWISRVIMLAVTVCMFQLAPANERYRQAGVMRAVMLGCNLITSFLSGSTLLTLAASIVSIIAVYQEYNAHSELAADKDEKLSHKWRSLFTWSILAAVLLSFGAAVVAVILVMADMEGGASHISGIAVGLLSIPQCVIEIVYILYIRKTISLFDNEVE